MVAGKIVKQLLIERDMKVQELAEKMGLSSAQVLSTKLYRDSFSYEDMVKIADILNCDVKIIMRDTGKEFWDRPSQTKNSPKNEQKQAKTAPITEEEAPKPEPRTRKGLSPDIEKAREMGKTALEIYEETLAARRGPETDEERALREKRYAEYRQETEEIQEARRKRAEEWEAVLRRRAEETPPDDENPDEAPETP